MIDVIIEFMTFITIIYLFVCCNSLAHEISVDVGWHMAIGLSKHTQQTNYFTPFQLSILLDKLIRLFSSGMMCYAMQLKKNFVHFRFIIINNFVIILF